MYLYGEEYNINKFKQRKHTSKKVIFISFLSKRLIWLCNTSELGDTPFFSTSELCPSSRSAQFIEHFFVNKVQCSALLKASRCLAFNIVLRFRFWTDITNPEFYRSKLRQLKYPTISSHSHGACTTKERHQACSRRL